MLKLRHPEFIEGRALPQRHGQFNNPLHRTYVSSRILRQVGYNTNAVLLDALISGRIISRWVKKYGEVISRVIQRYIFGFFVISFSALQLLPTTGLEATEIKPNENQPQKIAFTASVKAAASPIFQRPVQGSLSQGFWYVHPAIDIPNPYGTKVKPVAEGEVTFAGWDGGYGYTVIIKHKAGFSSLYAHLAQINVAKGKNVTKETTVGLVGTTGITTGSHLHLEMYNEGKNIDPQKYLPKN